MKSEFTRRRLLRSIGVATAAGALNASGNFPLWGFPGHGHPGIRFGAQTNAWAINPKDFSSFLAVLGQVRQIGYTGFETGFANVMQQFSSPQTGRAEIEKTGLTFFGMHVYLPHRMYDPATNLPPASLYKKIAPGGVALGAHHLIFSGAPCDTAEQLQHKIAGLNAAGQYSKSVGLPLAYHNETAQESQSKLGELEALYDRTDPEYVSFLLDCGHAYEGGMNVPAFARKHHARIVGLHLRDYKDGKQVVLGDGTFPLKELAAALKQVHWHGWVLNEEERLNGSKHGSEYMKPAFQAMRGAFSA
ncbi:MAG: sugar phosphate isomerase/epimerase [Acidobacteriaceae bacterium]